MRLKGRIFKGIGGFYYVDAPSGVVECRARGRFRMEKITPMIGDEVIYDETEEGKGYLIEILPRKNLFLRPPVSNIDILAIVASAADPVTETLLIDRMSAVAAEKGIEPLVVINKCDIDRGDKLYECYMLSGIATVRTSARTGEGGAELCERLRGKVSAFSGNSGVGKSSLLNMLEPKSNAEVGEINERIGRGKHTTRHCELFKLENGAVIADTPGFSSFAQELSDQISKEALQYMFPEFEGYIGGCRYVGCTHTRDEGCAVRAGMEKGEISESRYKSYLWMYEKAKEIKEWERDKNPR